jgi:hypothetical protein
MNIEFFGWLTKGKCEVSLLDVIIFFIEAGLLSAMVICITSMAKSKE